MIDNQEELWNEDAENNILGIMMVDNDKAATVFSLLDNSDFYTKANRDIFKCIYGLIKANKIADIVSVSEQLKFDKLLEECGGREHITELAMNLTSTANYKQYCKIIVKYSKKRKMMYSIDEANVMIQEGKDIEDVANYLKNGCETVLLSKTSTNLTSLFAGIDDVMEEVDTVLSSDSRTFGLATGFKELDMCLSGLCKAKLYILGARPRVGKSALAQQIAEYVAQGHNVLFHSLEMRSSQYTKRSLFRLSGLNNDLLTRGLISKDDAMDKLAKASGELAELKLEIDDEPDCNLKTIEKNIVSMRNNKGGCDLVIVDYLQLMGGTSRKQTDRFEIVSKNSRGLKRLANKYDVPILILCQLSRQVDSRENKRPQLSDLRDSGDIEQDADVVMFIYREEVYNPSPICRGKAELIIAKNREGSCKVIPMAFNGASTQFMEIKPYEPPTTNGNRQFKTNTLRNQ